MAGRFKKQIPDVKKMHTEKDYRIPSLADL
jgi:hypothetical protein